ncbi:MAG: hypothetical protein ABIO65_01950 [Nitrospiria bacterium]
MASANVPSLIMWAAAILVLGAWSGQAAEPPTPQKSPVALSNTTIPLAEHPQGRQMMATAARQASLVDIRVQFLDKTYKKDVYVREPVTGKKARVSCRRFRGVSGFTMRIDEPQFTLTTKGLTISENISRISAQGIKVKWQLGPCVENTAGIGVSMSDVTFVYKARPMLTFDGNGICRLTFNQASDNFRVKIGGFNITGVQNDLDKLIKDAFRESMNVTLNGMYGQLISDELMKVTVDVCGRG